MAIDTKQIVQNQDEESIADLLKKLIAGSPKDIVGVVTPIHFDATVNGKIYAATTCSAPNATIDRGNRNVYCKKYGEGYKNDDLRADEYIPDKLEFLLSDGTTRTLDVTWKSLVLNGGDQILDMNNRQLSWSTSIGKTSGVNTILIRGESEDDKRNTLISKTDVEKAYVQLYATVKELPSGITDSHNLTKNLDCRMYVLSKTVTSLSADA